MKWFIHTWRWGPKRTTRPKISPNGLDSTEIERSQVSWGPPQPTTGRCPRRSGVEDLALDLLSFALRRRAAAWRADPTDAHAIDAARALTDLGNALRTSGRPEAALEVHGAALHVHFTNAQRRATRRFDGWVLPSLFNLGLCEVQVGAGKG